MDLREIKRNRSVNSMGVRMIERGEKGMRREKAGLRPLGKLFPLTTFRREWCSGEDKGGERNNEMRLCGGTEVYGGLQLRGTTVGRGE
jgi:hypothetical protein